MDQWVVHGAHARQYRPAAAFSFLSPDYLNYSYFIFLDPKYKGLEGKLDQILLAKLSAQEGSYKFQLFCMHECLNFLQKTRSLYRRESNDSLQYLLSSSCISCPEKMSKNISEKEIAEAQKARLESQGALVSVYVYYG